MYVYEYKTYVEMRRILIWPFPKSPMLFTFRHSALRTEHHSNLVNLNFTLLQNYYSSIHTLYTRHVLYLYLLSYYLCLCAFSFWIHWQILIHIFFIFFFGTIRGCNGKILYAVHLSFNCRHACAHCKSNKSECQKAVTYLAQWLSYRIE